jgi:integrase/recombinase XerD
MSKPLATLPTVTPVAVTDAESTDEQLINLWLHGRSAHTVRAYRRDVERLRAFTRDADLFPNGKPLREITLGNLQAFADSLEKLGGEASSRARVIAVVKSLLSFAFKLGATPFNVGAALRKPPARDTLADRIMDEAAVAKMFALTEGNAREHALIRLLYASAFRVSELVSLRWKDCADAEGGAMCITVLGKGGKTRTVRIKAKTANVLRALKGNASLEAYVFPGRFGGALDVSQARRIVYAIVKRAGIGQKVSPHWFRHAHASHALEHGARVTLVRDTLGHSSIAVTDRYAHARPGESSGDVLTL